MESRNKERTSLNSRSALGGEGERNGGGGNGGINGETRRGSDVYKWRERNGEKRRGIDGEREMMKK